MSLLIIDNETLGNAKVMATTRAFFDNMDLIEIGEETNTFRVSKASYGLVYLEDDIVTVGARLIPTTIIPANVDKCHVVITELNSLGVEHVNYGCEQDACVSYEHKSEGTNHVKSKG